MCKYFKLYIFSITLAFLFMTSSFITSSHAQFGDESGPNTVFAILPEPPGANCANGGTLIASGLDNNGNGFLNFNEVQQIGYACNGADGNGIPGPPGPQGPQGVAGTDGIDGADGAVGATGPAGSDGAPGADGATGPAGADGAQGPQGEQGPAGADGTDGVAGADGAPGADGAVGPQGPAGADGADGAVGPQGPRGDDFVLGPPVRSNGYPECNGLFGSESIIFIDMNDNDIFEPGAGDIDTGSRLTICDGQTGLEGTQGIQGIQGIPGQDGTDGVDGQDGAPGTDGAPGAQGAQGPQGVRGPQGPQGPPATVPGFDGWYDIRTVSCGANNNCLLDTSCPIREYCDGTSCILISGIAVSGICGDNGLGFEMEMIYSGQGAVNTNRRWRCKTRNTFDQPRDLRLGVYCTYPLP